MVPYGSGILSFAILPPVVLEVSKKLFFMKKTGIPDRDPRKRDEEKSRLNFLFFYLSGLGLFRKPQDPSGQIARAKGFRMDPFIGHAGFGKRSAHVVHEGCRTADVRVGVGRAQGSI